MMSNVRRVYHVKREARKRDVYVLKKRPIRETLHSRNVVRLYWFLFDVADGVLGLFYGALFNRQLF